MTKSGDYIATVKWCSNPQHTVCPFRVHVLQQTACSGMRSTNGMPLLGRLLVICWEYKKWRARFTTLPTTHTFLPPHTRIHAKHAHTTPTPTRKKLQVTCAPTHACAAIKFCQRRSVGFLPKVYLFLSIFS